MDARTNRWQKQIKPPKVPYVVDIGKTPSKSTHNNTEKSVGISCLFHVMLLSAFALTFQMVELPQKPIAIELSFGSSEEPIDIITDGIDLLSSEDSSNSLEESLADTDQEALALPAVLGEPEIQIDPPVPTPMTASSSEATLSNIEPSDLLTEITETNEDSLPQTITNQNVSAENSSLSEANQAINGILTGLNNGVNANSLAQTRAGNGAGGGIENRLASYGAKTGDLQISIAWNSLDDVDLHVMFFPGQSINGVENISFGSKYGPKTGGYLDIDMNANGNMSTTPVENIFYPAGNTPSGRYSIFVHLYRSRTGNMSVPVVLRIKNKDKVTFQQIQATPIFERKHTVLYNLPVPSFLID